MQLPALATGQGVDLGRTLLLAEQIKGARAKSGILQKAAATEDRRKGMRAGIVGAGGEVDQPALQRYAAEDPAGAKQITDAISAMDTRQMAKLKETNQISGSLLMSVESAPPEQRPAVYAQALAEAERMGLKTNLPQQYNPQVVQQRIKLALSVGEQLEQQEIARKAKADVVKVMTPTGVEYVRKDQAAGMTPYEKPIAVGAKSRLVDPNTQEVLYEPPEAEEGGADFGKGLRGRTLSVLTDDAAAYGAGLLSPEDENRFMAALTEYVQPKTFADPDTGLMQTRRPDLPPFVRDALAQRGVSMEQIQQLQPPGGQPAAPAAPAPEEAAPELSAEAPAAPAAPAVGADQKIFDLAFATGPIPAFGRGLAETPLVGDLIQSPQWTQARERLEGERDTLTKVLQNSPRYAQGEREDIQKRLSDKVVTKVWDNPAAFQNRMIGIDDFLQKRQQNAEETAASEGVSRMERQHALDVANGIRQFRDSLGVPPRVRSVEEARQLPPGTRFVDPSGKVRMVPGAQ